MKTRWLALLLPVAGMLCLFGCRQSDENTPPQATSAVKGGTVNSGSSPMGNPRYKGNGDELVGSKLKDKGQ